jgi:enoyl-CoA hydratase
VAKEKPILVKVDGGICWISLNRPDKLNCMTVEMHELIWGALDEAEADGSIGCIVITGVGNRAFCAGADVSHLEKLSPNEAKEFSEKGHKTLTKILNCSKPVVAAVNGYALGGGCELAAACDFRIASEKARFGQPEINLGLVPGWGGTQLLQKIIGPARAKEVIMTGAMLNAQEAQQIGLVNKVVEADKLKEEVGAFAESLSRGPNIAVMEAKRLVNLSLELNEGLTEEANAFSKLFSTEDFKEGVAAFKEKRKPSFKGR